MNSNSIKCIAATASFLSTAIMADIVGLTPNLIAIACLYAIFVFANIYVAGFIQGLVGGILGDLLKSAKLAGFLGRVAGYAALFYPVKFIISLFNINFGITGWQFIVGFVIYMLLKSFFEGVLEASVNAKPAHE
jgi:hypothetical protein